MRDQLDFQQFPLPWKLAAQMKNYKCLQHAKMQMSHANNDKGTVLRADAPVFTPASLNIAFGTSFETSGHKVASTNLVRKRRGRQNVHNNKAAARKQSDKRRAKECEQRNSLRQRVHRGEKNKKKTVCLSSNTVVNTKNISDKVKPTTVTHNDHPKSTPVYPPRPRGAPSSWSERLKSSVVRPKHTAGKCDESVPNLDQIVNGLVIPRSIHGGWFSLSQFHNNKAPLSPQINNPTTSLTCVPVAKVGDAVVDDPINESKVRIPAFDP
jgi:hypothetical protein